jgi:23S rRNA (pseudouridine1915-N3)-methyltransferase
LTQITLIAVGRMKAGALSDLADMYLKRFAALGPVRIVEVDARDKAREAEAILAKVPEGAALVALDERGKTLSSPGLADWIGRQQNDAVQHLVFVIGGADGLDESVRKRANLVMAFGQMTWPHMMVRVMLLEQLYRAQQILAGHPYHRE